MGGSVQVTITVRKYTWNEFVHDVCYVLYAAIMISNALSKRYLHLSLRQLYNKIVFIPSLFAKALVYSGLIGLGLVTMGSLFAVPVILFLAATGKIH